MEKQYKASIDKATALDFAIRDGQEELDYGYEISGKSPYNNYLSNDDWKRFLNSMSPLHFAQYNDADGGELIEKKGRWGLNPPKMASFGSSSRLIYECSKSIPSFYFEKQLPTRVGHTANLDGYLRSPESDVFVEAKCREIYSTHLNQKISLVYRDVYEYIKSKNPGFSYKCKPIEDEPDYMACSFIMNNKYISHFDVKQLICHFLGICANILENKANTHVRFLYLIFNPNFDTDFSNPYISNFQSKILEEYKETLAEINIFGDFKWLFDAVMDYQSEHLDSPRPKCDFKFELQDHMTYTSELIRLALSHNLNKKN
jgi:hypothetical protein